MTYSGFNQGRYWMGTTPDDLRDKAERYRWLADRSTDQQAIQALRQLAEHYDELALELERRSVKAAKSE